MKYIIKIDKQYRTFYNMQREQHREEGPSRERINGYKHHMINGKFHNINKPARVWDEEQRQEYWIDGRFITSDNDVFIKYKKRNNIT